MFYFDWSAIFLKVIAPCWWWPVSTGVITIRPISAVQVSNHKAHEALDTLLPRGSFFQSLTVGISKSQMWCSMHFMCIRAYFSGNIAGSGSRWKWHSVQVFRHWVLYIVWMRPVDAKHFHDKSPSTHSVERIHAGFTFQGQNSCSKREGVLPSKSYVQKNGLEPSLGWYY